MEHVNDQMWILMYELNLPIIQKLWNLIFTFNDITVTTALATQDHSKIVHHLLNVSQKLMEQQ